MDAFIRINSVQESSVWREGGDIVVPEIHTEDRGKREEAIDTEEN